jgi:hypothetical protein
MLRRTASAMVVVINSMESGVARTGLFAQPGQTNSFFANTPALSLTKRKFRPMHAHALRPFGDVQTSSDYGFSRTRHEAYTLVDIAELQMCHFRPACPGAIERHQKDAIKGEFGGID